jgi:hypothetical protein
LCYIWKKRRLLNAKKTLYYPPPPPHIYIYNSVDSSKFDQNPEKTEQYYSKYNQKEQYLNDSNTDTSLIYCYNPLDEANTRLKLINPALFDSGWTLDHIKVEQSTGGIFINNKDKAIRRRKLHV